MDAYSLALVGFLLGANLIKKPRENAQKYCGNKFVAGGTSVVYH